MSDRFVAATRKGLFTFARTGQGTERWVVTRTDFLGDNVSMVLSDSRAGHIHAALDHGHFGVKVHRASEAARDWQELTAPTYPPKPEDLVENDMWGRPLPWSTVRIWALEAAGSDAPGVLWCGTIPGGLFKSSDAGDSWSIVAPLWHDPLRSKWMGGGADLPGIHSISIDPRSSDTVRIGISTGGMWQTDDGGATWACRAKGIRADYLPPEQQFEPNMQDVHRLAQCRDAPDVLWVQHHNGIFRSTDGGANWSEITGVPVSTFGFAVVAHPHDSETAWFVPAINDQRRIPEGGRFAVTRTQDGGKSFEVLDRGLPADHAYDIVYRHGLDIDGEGRRLVMGSTTGAVWVSEDAGETWQCAASRLPPVYCVRFLSA
jgi:hypothetical protein